MFLNAQVQPKILPLDPAAQTSSPAVALPEAAAVAAAAGPGSIQCGPEPHFDQPVISCTLCVTPMSPGQPAHGSSHS